MTNRPGEWDLLGYDGDPCPGDPPTVRDESTHYNAVASSITDQIRRLKRLAEPDEALQGHYTEGLQDSCDDLADHLGKIEERFRETGRQLSGFASDLTTVRVTTGMALSEAVDAKRRMDANAPQEGGSGDPTEAQKQAAEDRAGRHDAAEGDLAAARTKAHHAMDAFDGEAEKVARAIKDASDDDMKDSRWDKFKDAVGSIAGVLDGIADVLGWIAAALTIVALFIPGLNLLVIAAFVIAGLALAIHTLLAVTGNGSWLDVAFDVIGILTLRMGTVAIKGAQAGRAVTLANAGRAAGGRASSAALARASFNGGRGILGGAHKLLLRTFSPTVRSAMRTAYDDAFRTWVTRSVPNSTVLEGLKAGADRGLASLVKDHRLLLQELGETAIDPAYTANLTKALTALRINVGTMAPLAINPEIGPFEGYSLPGWSDLEDALTITIGGPF